MSGKVLVSNEWVGVFAVTVGKGVAKQPIGDGADDCVEEVLDQDVSGVLRADGAALQIGETRLVG